MKNFLNMPLAQFAKLSPRERFLAVLAAVALLAFVINISLLEPQQRKLRDLRRLNDTHVAELGTINRTLAQIESDVAKGLDPFAEKRAVLNELKRQIADAALVHGQMEVTNSQVGTLIRELIDDSSGVALVSLKTLPAAVFQLPDSTVPGSGVADPGNAPPTLYRQGIEVNLRGNYMALLSYLENLQKYPKRLFWSEARLESSGQQEPVLRLVIYYLSKQPGSPLR